MSFGAEVIETATGAMVAGSTDQYGIFAPVGTDLSNRPFTLTFAYNPALFTQDLNPAPNSYIYYPPTAETPGALQVSLRVGKVTYTVLSGATAFIGCCGTSMSVDAAGFVGGSPQLQASYTSPSPSATLINPGSPAPGSNIKFEVGPDLATYYGTVTQTPGIYFQKDTNSQAEDISKSPSPIPVIVGQNIALTGIPATGHWVTPVLGNPIGGFDVSSDCSNPAPPSCHAAIAYPDFSSNSTNFFWYIQNEQEIDYSYMDQNGTNVVLKGLFFVDGPHVAHVKSVLGDIYGLNLGGVNFMEFGVNNLKNPNPNDAGIQFESSPSSLTSLGTLEWIQKLDLYAVTHFQTSGPPISPPIAAGLDTEFPYQPSNSHDTNDSPNIQLCSTDAMVTASQHFSMYLMWQSSKKAGAAFVPLGHVDWQWNGVASRNSAGAWQVTPGQKEAKFISIMSNPSIDFPVWTLADQPPSVCK